MGPNEIRESESREVRKSESYVQEGLEESSQEETISIGSVPDDLKEVRGCLKNKPGYCVNIHDYVLNRQTLPDALSSHTFAFGLSDLSDFRGYSTPKWPNNNHAIPSVNTILKSCAIRKAKSGFLFSLLNRSENLVSRPIHTKARANHNS